MSIYSECQVYMGNYAVYPIPPEVWGAACMANAGKRMSDRRTRGHKMIEAWGKQQDKLASAQLRATA